MEVIEIIVKEIEVVEVVERGPAGPVGPQGPVGPAGPTPADASQAEMEAGSEVGIRQMSPLRVAQAIEARLAAGIIIDGGGL